MALYANEARRLALAGSLTRVVFRDYIRLRAFLTVPSRYLEGTCVRHILWVFERSHIQSDRVVMCVSDSSRERHDNCDFCRIHAGEDTNTIVLKETENVVVFADKYPHARIHLLAIPKTHIQSVNHLTAADLPLLKEMKEAGMAALKALPNVDPAVTFVVFHCPPRNSVHHLHLHFVIDPMPGYSYKYDVLQGESWVRSFDAEVALLSGSQAVTAKSKCIEWAACIHLCGG